MYVSPQDPWGGAEQCRRVNCEIGRLFDLGAGRRLVSIFVLGLHEKRVRVSGRCRYALGLVGRIRCGFHAKCRAIRRSVIPFSHCPLSLIRRTDISSSNFNAWTNRIRPGSIILACPVAAMNHNNRVHPSAARDKPTANDMPIVEHRQAKFADDDCNRKLPPGCAARSNDGDERHEDVGDDPGSEDHSKTRLTRQARKWHSVCPMRSIGSAIPAAHERDMVSRLRHVEDGKNVRAELDERNGV